MGRIRADQARPGDRVDLGGHTAVVTAVEIDGPRVRIRVDLDGGAPFSVHTAADALITTVEEGE